MNITRIKPFVLPFIVVLAVGVFILDLRTPMGYADWICYPLLMLFSVYGGGRYIQFLLAAVFSVLMAGGFFLAVPGIDPWIADMNRLMGISMLWLMAVVLSERSRMQQEREKALRELTATNDSLASLNQVTANAISSLDLEVLLQVLLLRLVEVMHADAAVVLLKEDGHLATRASVGLEAAVAAKFSVRIGQGFSGTIAQTLKPLYIADAQSDERVLGPFAKQRGIRSMLGVPMIRGGKLVGVLHLDWVEPHPLRQPEMQLLEITAERCAVAILNAQLFEHVKRSEERYHSLFENMLGGFAYCRMVFEDDRPQDFIYLEVNDAFEKLTGLKNVVGKKVTDVIPGIRESNPELFEIYGRVVRTGQPERFETYVAGLGIWFSIAVYRPEAGCFVAIFDNITARKQADEQVRESEDRYRSLVEESPDAIGIYQDGELIFVNSTGARKLGAQTKEELLGRKTEQMIHPEDLPDAMDRIRRRLGGETGMYPAEIRYVRLDGTTLPVEVSASPIILGGKPAVQFIARDITARQRADARLRDSEALYHSLVENLPQHVFRKDLAGRFTFGNGPFCRSLGKPLAEILGKTDLDFCPAELAAKYQRDDQRVVQTGQSFEGEEEHQQADGKTIFVNVIKTPLRDAVGKINGLQGISWDITGRKQLEEQFRQAQKMEAIGQLAAGVAHDFNNMLAVIHGNAEMALMFADQPGDNTRECINQVIAASERAANLTRQLLAFGRKQVMQSTPLDLNEVIGNLTKMLTRIIGENISLECAFATRLPVVQADVGMMEQVLLNLVVNARDALPHGGQLLIKTEQINVDEAYAATHPEAHSGEFICISVSDTGTGIAPEDLPRIFEPFFTTKEAGKGTGLGLATIYGIVKQHQGWVEVATQPGAGTTFRIFLPVILSPVTEAAAPPAAPDLRGGTETILLVEDDSAVRLVTRRILEAFDYRVVEAATGREALAVWQSRAAEIDLLLTDIVMPDGVTGRELAAAILVEKPALKAIFMSGYSLDTAGKGTEFIRRTKSYFLQKPFSSRVLIQTVRQCLDEK